MRWYHDTHTHKAFREDKAGLDLHMGFVNMKKNKEHDPGFPLTWTKCYHDVKAAIWNAYDGSTEVI